VPRGATRRENRFAEKKPVRILTSMWRRRLTGNRQNSPFSSLLNVLFILIGAVAICITFIGSQRAIALDTIPGCGCGPRHEHVCFVTLTTTASESYYWNEEGPFPIKDFRVRFAAWLKVAKEPQVLIAADDSARFGDSVRLLDEARKQGVSSARFESRTRPRP
jgi:biopolymer transport protein ExbD